jgi:hypothetical protein
MASLDVLSHSIEARFEGSGVGNVFEPSPADIDESL